MAWDDPIVWVLIIAVVVFLFGANKIPQLARAVGQARKEFNQVSREITNPTAPSSGYPQPSPAGSASFQNASAIQPKPTLQDADPLILAAQREGIDVTGKTRDQIASELAWKLKSS